MKILIQIPCFNEELQIKKIIEDIRKSLDTYNYEKLLTRTILIQLDFIVINIIMNYVKKYH